MSGNSFHTIISYSHYNIWGLRLKNCINRTAKLYEKNSHKLRTIKLAQLKIQSIAHG